MGDEVPVVVHGEGIFLFLGYHRSVLSPTGEVVTIVGQGSDRAGLSVWDVGAAAADGAVSGGADTNGERLRGGGAVAVKLIEDTCAGGAARLIDEQVAVVTHREGTFRSVTSGGPGKGDMNAVADLYGVVGGVAIADGEFL